MSLGFLSQIGEVLSLNQSEETVYRVLLKHGALDRSSLKELTALKEDELANSIRNLQAKDLIFLVSDNFERYFAFTPFQYFTEEFGDLKSTTLDLTDEIEASRESINTHVSRASNELLNAFNENIREIKETVRVTIEDTVELLDESIKTFEESASSTEESKKEVDQLQKVTDATFQDVREGVNEAVNKGIQAVGKHLDELEAELQEEINKLKKTPPQFTTRLTEIRTELEATLSQTEETFTEKVEELREEAKSEEAFNAIDALSSSLITILEKFFEEFETRVKTIEDELASSFSASVANLNEAYLRGIERLDSTIAQRQEEIGSNITESLQDIKLKAHEELKQEISNIEEKTNANFSSIRGEWQETKENVIAQVEETPKTLQEQMKVTLREHNSALEERTEKYTGRIDTLLVESGRLLEEVKNTFNQRASQLIQSFATLEDDIGANVASTITNEVNKVIQTKMDITTRLWEGISNTMDHFSNEMKKIAQIGDETIEEVLLTPFTGMDKDMQEILGEKKGKYASLFEQEKKKTKKQIKKALKESNLQERQETISSLVKRGTHLLEEMPEEPESDTRKELKEIFAKLEQATSSLSTSCKDLPNVTMEKLEEGPSMATKKITAITGDLEEDLLNLYQERKKKAEQIYRQKKGKIGEAMGDGFNVMQDSMRTIMQESREKLDSIVGELNTGLEQMKTEIKEDLGEQISESQKIVREDKNVLFEDLSSFTNQMEEKLSAIRDQLKEGLKERKETSSQIIENAERRLEKQEEAIKTSLSSTLEEIDNVTREMQTALLESNTNVQAITSERIEETIQQAEGLLSRSNELIKEEIEKERDELSGKLREETKALENKIERDTTEIDDMLERERDKATSEVRTKITSETSTVKQSLSDFHEHFAEVVMDMEGETTTIINSLHTSLSDGIENIGTELRKEIRELVATTNKTTSEVKREHFANMKEELQEIKEAHSNTLSGQEQEVSDSLKKLNNVLETIPPKLKEKQERHKKMRTKYTGSLRETFNDEMESMRDTSKDKLEDIKEDINEILGKNFQTLQEHLSETAKRHQSLEERASKMKKELMALEKEKVATLWQIHGQRGIYSQIKSMVKRAEQSFTLRTSILPKELIELLKRSKGGLEILLSEDVEDAAIEALKQDAWIHKTKERIRGMVAVRDGEEVLIVPKIKDEVQDWNGITFFSEEGLPIKF